MILESEVRDQLAALAAGLSVFEFGDWLDEASWGMHTDSAPDAIRLVSSIDRMFADYDRHGDESALRRELIGIGQKDG